MGKARQGTVLREVLGVLVNARRKGDRPGWVSNDRISRITPESYRYYAIPTLQRRNNSALRRVRELRRVGLVDRRETATGRVFYRIKRKFAKCTLDYLATLI